MSYGANVADGFRKSDKLRGQDLNGRKASGSSCRGAKFELVINRKDARALDLAVPTSLLAGADEVIE